MAYKWKDVTDEMEVSAVTSPEGMMITVSHEGSKLFLIDKEGVHSVRRRCSTYSKPDNGRRYIYLCKEDSGSLKEVMDSTEYRLSMPECTIPNSFCNFTDLMLERKVKAPDWGDVTAECRPILIKSNSSPGYYVRMVHKGRTVALLGVSKKGYVLGTGVEGKYTVEAARNATISFNIFKKNC